MIPILYASTETQFTSNGIGRLVDCISCTVTEERNGIYECELQYPINGRHFSDLIQGGIIGVIHDDNGDIQPFDIYKHTAEIGGIVTFNARHISYRLGGICVSPFTANSCADALTAIGTNSVQTNPFTFTTNKTISKIYETDIVKSARGILMGEAGSILQAFQGEYKFDKWTVSLLTARGSDTGVTVRYGKNMTGISLERDDSGCFNAVAPYWTDGTVTVSLPEVYVQPTTPITPIICVPLDMSQMIEGQPTEAQLRQEAIDYLDEKETWKPVDKITVDFVAMWQTPEYANVASIQRIGLCDTVSIYWTDMNIVSEKAKVVSVVYNVLAERFDQMSVGTVSNEFVAITGEAAGTTIIPITGGGTSADNAADARTNLGLGTSADINAIAYLRGEAIPSGADLNSYTTPGEYYIQNGTIAASLSNCPYTSGNSRLSYLQGGSTEWGAQILTATGNADVYVYKRQHDVNGGTWSSWVRVLTDNDIGDRVTTEPSAVTVANNSNVQIATVTLSAGKWICYFVGRFTSNATGYRKIFVLRGTSSSPWVGENASSNAVSGDYTWLNMSIPISITTSTQFKLMAYQNSGSSLSTTGRIYCTKII